MNIQPITNDIYGQITAWFKHHRPDITEYSIDELPDSLAKAWNAHVFGIMVNRSNIARMQTTHSTHLVTDYPNFRPRTNSNLSLNTGDNSDNIPTISTKSIDKIDGHYVITYCRYSGVILSSVPKMFIGEGNIHFGKHWMFDQKLDSLFKYHYDNKSKTHQMRQLLALALILNKNILGNIITANSPIAFPETKLTRNYGQLVLVANKIRSLTPESRGRFLKNLPKFTTDAFTTNGITRHSTETIGSNLIEFICSTVLPALMARTDTTIEYSELEIESELMRIELTERVSKVKNPVYSLVPSDNLSTSNEYWDYILADIEQSFDLPSKAIDLYRIQIETPNDTATLVELQTLLRGLLESSKIDDNLTVPSLQFKFALAEITNKLKAVKTPEKLQLLTDTVMISSSVTTDDGNAVVTQRPVTAEGTSNNSTLQALMAKRKQRITNSEELAADFVVKYKSKLNNSEDK